MREKQKRRESSSIFLHHSESSSNPSLTSKRSEVIEEGDQVRSIIRSRLHELTLPWRADRSEDFVWTIRRGRMFVRLWATRENFHIYVLDHGVRLSMLRYWVWNLISSRLDLLLNAIFDSHACHFRFKFFMHINSYHQSIYRSFKIRSYVYIYKLNSLI